MPIVSIPPDAITFTTSTPRSRRSSKRRLDPVEPRRLPAQVVAVTARRRDRWTGGDDPRQPGRRPVARDERAVVAVPEVADRRHRGPHLAVLRLGDRRVDLLVGGRTHALQRPDRTL
ncbi:MAG TPA: hypothetical protein VNQ53_17155 [Nocardioides sp.]|nr:hypothetical protein [Nocardioides sp.]